MKRWSALATIALLLPLLTIPVQGALEIAGEPTQRSPRPKPDLAEARNKLRMQRAGVIRELGYDVDWTRYSSSELLDIELRIRKAQELKAKLGYQAVWEVESLEELSDKEARLVKARSLERKGILVNWTTCSLATLTDLESRLAKAARLKEIGAPVDWRKHSLKELAQMESRLLELRRVR